VAISADGHTAIVGGDVDRGGFAAAWIWVRGVGEWTQQGPKLLGSDAVGLAERGSSVSISADGKTAALGWVGDGYRAGAVWVWRRIGDTWVQDGPKLSGTGGHWVGLSSQGASVSLSSDGSTLAVGGPSDAWNTGAVWIWTRNSTGWIQQGPKLVGTGGEGESLLGTSVALSADGNTLVAGGPGDAKYLGAAWVWARSDGVWAQQGVKLTVSGYYGPARLGQSVSFSADGNTVLVGAPSHQPSGTGFIWKRSGDVWIEQARLVGSGVSGFSPEQGTSVALSGDGNTALLGAPNDHSSAEGAAWVFTRSGNTWAQQGPKLVGSDATYARQGEAVALSADGNTALIGGPWDDRPVGAVWVWARNGSTWAQQGPKLVGTGATSQVYQGSAVSISADGNTALVGGPGDGGRRGAVWAWTRLAGIWTQHGSKLVGAGAIESVCCTSVTQGWSVSVNADGTAAIVGGPGDDDGVGAAWVWTRATRGWAQQAKLVGAAAVGRSSQGVSVSLSADGNTAIVGGRFDASGVGAAWVWTRGARGWAQQEKLVGTDAVGTANQGGSVSLSADGNTALVGGRGDAQGIGAAWVWTRGGNSWSQQGPKLVGTAAIGAAQQGVSVSLSADGNTAVIAGDRDDSGRGAVWVWTRSQGVWTQQAKLVGSGAGLAPAPGRLSLSADGNTLIVGQPRDNSYAGAAWVWKRVAGGWIQQSAKLVGSGAVGQASQGWSVSLSGDGTMALIGGPQDDWSSGAAWVFALGRTLYLPTLGWRFPVARVDPASSRGVVAPISTPSLPTGTRPDEGVSWRAVASTTSTFAHDWPASIDLRQAVAASLRFSSSLSTRASWAEVQARTETGAWRTLAVLTPMSAAGAMTLDLRSFLGQVVGVRFVFHALAPTDGAEPDTWLVSNVRADVTVAAPLH